MNSSEARRSVQKRLGGRTADVTARVQKAIVDLIFERGVDGCTFSAVAERAGVERSTLYRRFPDRWEAIIDALMARAASDVMPDVGTSFPEDLASVLDKLVTALSGPLGQAVIAAAVELRAEKEENRPRAYFDQRMAQLAPMFDRAVERGELPPAVDREELFSFAAGAVYFRLFIAGREVDDDFIRKIVANTCWLYCSPSVAAKLSLSGRLA